MNKLKILYHFPNPQTAYANRTIAIGFKNAFKNLEHEFRFLTADDDFKGTIKEFRPNIFITVHHFYYRKWIDYDFLKSYKKHNQLFVLTKIGPYEFPNTKNSKIRIQEEAFIKNDLALLKLIENGTAGDVYFSPMETFDPRIKNFEKETGQKYITIPLAADIHLIKDAILEDNNYKYDLSFIGTNLPAKKELFNTYLFPLKENYNLKLIGQDWTYLDKLKGWVSRFGQYYNIPYVKNAYKQPLKLIDEYKIYHNSQISLNIHNSYQREFGGDCNERTFKIPLAMGFEITDNVKAIHKYFQPDELVIAKNPKEWFEKIDYYMNHPSERVSIAKRAYLNVIKNHTYNNRALKIINTYNSFYSKTK